MSQPSELWPSVPGLPAASLPARMAPLLPPATPWRSLGVEAPGRGGSRPPSAVMMLFIPGEEPAQPARLVFTRRSTSVRSHKGQISFAGGRSEPSDPSPAATAVRELHEEVGVNPDLVTVVGVLEPIGALDGHGVYPVVGVAPLQLSDMAPAPEEVAAVFATPWPEFAQSCGREFGFNLFGNWRTSWIYESPAGNIWGLTALMLRSAALA